MFHAIKYCRERPTPLSRRTPIMPSHPVQVLQRQRTLAFYRAISPHAAGLTTNSIGLSLWDSSTVSASSFCAADSSESKLIFKGLETPFGNFKNQTVIRASDLVCFEIKVEEKVERNRSSVATAAIDY